MDVDEAPSATPVVKETPTKKKEEKEKEVTDILPESDVYLRLLVVLALIDAGDSEKVSKALLIMSAR